MAKFSKHQNIALHTTVTTNNKISTSKIYLPVKLKRDSTLTILTMAVNIHNEHRATVEDLAKLCRNQHRRMAFFFNHGSWLAVVIGSLTISQISECWYSLKMKKTKGSVAEHAGWL